MPRSPARLRRVLASRAAPPLRDHYVRSGQVSWEYRPYLLFPTDPGVFLLLRCQGPAAFFRAAEQLYADQRQLGRPAPGAAAGAAAAARELAPAQQAARDRPRRRARPVLPPARHARGADEPVPRRRRSAARSSARSSARGDSEDGVTGTPTFLINGEKQEAAQLGAARAAAARGDRELRMKARALLAALAAAALLAVPAVGAARARPRRRRRRRATGRRPSCARPKAASGWAIPTRR